MKKLVSALIILCVIMTSLGFLACGSKTELSATSANTPVSTGAASSATTSAATQSTSAGGGGALWDDVPVYPGADQMQKGSWAIPPAEGDYSKVEWRYYNTSDSMEKVSDYYQEKMPAKGWTQTGWMEVGEMNWGMFNKNDEEDASMVWISSEEGKTVIALWRASR